MNPGSYYRNLHHQPVILAVLMVFIFALAGCQSVLPAIPQPSVTSELDATSSIPTVEPTRKLSTMTPAVSTPAASVETFAYDPSVPDSWQQLPIIPVSISQRVQDLYARGQQNGLNPNAFSKVGDCETSSEYFLAPFDYSEQGYRLGDYSSLKTVIEKYSGSFERRSLAAKSSFSAASILAPVWADPSSCKSGESPLVCEIRLHKPALMLVMIGTNDVKTSSRTGFETNLKNLLNIAIANNIVPVLVTKADNLEGDGSYNAIIARVAYEYELPLLNYWRAMQPLPDGGLEPDQIHLTYAQPFFDSPENMQKGWPVRNLTALQMLEFLLSQLEP